MIKRCILLFLTALLAGWLAKQRQEESSDLESQRPPVANIFKGTASRTADPNGTAGQYSVFTKPTYTLSELQSIQLRLGLMKESETVKMFSGANAAKVVNPVISALIADRISMLPPGDAAVICYRLEDATKSGILQSLGDMHAAFACGVIALMPSRGTGRPTDLRYVYEAFRSESQSLDAVMPISLSVVYPRRGMAICGLAARLMLSSDWNRAAALLNELTERDLKTVQNVEFPQLSGSSAELLRSSCALPQKLYAQIIQDWTARSPLLALNWINSEAPLDKWARRAFLAGLKSIITTENATIMAEYFSDPAKPVDLIMHSKAQSALALASARSFPAESGAWLDRVPEGTTKDITISNMAQDIAAAPDEVVRKLIADTGTDPRLSQEIISLLSRRAPDRAAVLMTIFKNANSVSRQEH